MPRGVALDEANPLPPLVMANPSGFSPLQITKSLLFRTLTHRAAGFLGKPFMLYNVSRKALAKAGEDTSLRGMATGFVESVQRLVRLVRAYAGGTYRGVDKGNMALVVAAILYFLSPIDIIPDYIPVVGLLDDITLVTWVISTLSEELDRFEAYEDSNAPAYTGMTYQELYEEAREEGIEGRSKMSKGELEEAVDG